MASAVGLPAAGRRGDGRLALALAGLLVVLLVAFCGTWADMAAVWRTSETFGHGMLAAPIAAWLAWRRRAVAAAVPAAPSPMGAAAFALACAGWLVAELAGTAVVAQFAVVAMVPAAVWACGGAALAWAFAGPLAFLFFMVPAGEALNPWLMERTAGMTIAAVKLTGVPVFREGLHFMLPTGRWSVVEACSGLRYVIAAAMLSMMFALINFERLWRRVAFVAVAVAIALVANWARAFLVVMVGHLSGMTIGIGDDHVVFGWVFFGVTMAGVFALGARWRDREAPDPAASAPSIPPGAPASRRPLAGRPAGAVVATAAVLAALAAAPVLLAGLLRDVPPRDGFERRAREALGTPSGRVPVLQPEFAGDRGRAAAASDDGIERFVAYFARQVPDREMIAFGNDVLPGARGHWVPIAGGEREVSVDGAPLRVLEQRIRDGRDERLAWTWYTVAGDEAGGSAYRAKALTAWAMLRGRGDHSTVAVVSAPLPGLAAGAGDDEVDAALADARARLATASGPVRRLTRAATAP